MSYVSYVAENPDLQAAFEASGSSSAAQWGKTHWEAHGSGESRQKTPQNTRVASAPAPAPGGNPNAVTPNYTQGQLLGSNVQPSVNPASPTNQQYASYVDQYAGMNNYWDLINARLQGNSLSGMTGHQNMSPQDTADYWIKRMGGGRTKADFGRAHYGESVALHEGTYQGGTNVPTGTGVRRFGPAPGTTPGTDTTTTTNANINASSDGGGNTSINNIQTMDLASLTDGMMLSNAISELINTNSPLFAAAETRALQEMAKRGIVNSSLARESVMNAIMQVAMPIAQADVQTLQQNLYYNNNWSNKQKTEYNQYIYDTLKTKLEGAIAYTLRRGDWIAAIGTQSGMGTEATNWNIGALPTYPFDMGDNP